MSNYKIIYKNSFGGISVVNPSPRWLQENNHNYKKLADKLGIKTYKLVSANDLPNDRTFRDAWAWPETGNKVEISENVLRSLVRTTEAKVIGRHTKTGKGSQIAPAALESYDLQQLLDYKKELDIKLITER